MQATTAPAKRMSLPIRIIVGICGVVAIVAGASAIRRGMAEMRDDGMSAKASALIDSIEVAVTSGNTRTAAMQPTFMSLLSSVDSLGVLAVHRDKQDVARRVAAQLDSTVADLRRAASLSDSASKLVTQDARKRFLQAKVESYTRWADGTAINREIITMLMDESITSNGELLPKILAAAKQRDSLQAIGNAAQERAGEIAKEFRK